MSNDVYLCSFYKEINTNKPVEMDRVKENESTLLRELNATFFGAMHWLRPSCEYGLFDTQCNRANTYNLHCHLICLKRLQQFFQRAGKFWGFLWG